jgi:homoserine dehydrogenase
LVSKLLEPEGFIMAEQKVKVGVVGFGTVGCGVAKLILEEADSIAAKTGLRLELACAVDVDTESPRPVKLPEGILTGDLSRLLKDDAIKIGVELVGGTDAARQIQLQMLAAGKDVVTANKALLAEHGSELYEAAHKHNRCIAFEASCATESSTVPAITSFRI